MFLAANNQLTLTLGIFVLCNLPAVAMLTVGLVRIKEHPRSSKLLILCSIIYFIIGLGVCSNVVLTS